MVFSKTQRWAAVPLAFAAFTSQASAALTYKGCFSSSTPLNEADTYQYQSTGHCSALCLPSQAVMGLTAGNGCYCGAQMPAADTLVDDAKCNTPCTGYGSTNCGGTNYWSVYLTGISNDVTNYEASPPDPSSSSSSSSSSSTTTTSATTATVTSVGPANTVLVTVSASATPTTVTPSASSTPSSGASSGTSVAGVAAGVVVGIIALAAIVAGVFFFLRRRRRLQVEENYKRSNQVNDFMRGVGERKAPNTAHSQMSDARLDPEAGRRNSVGSMADEHDYSRRILRVANPDSH